jgi:hypothetical protein
MAHVENISRSSTPRPKSTSLFVDRTKPVSSATLSLAEPQLKKITCFERHESPTNDPLRIGPVGEISTGR